MQGWNVGYSAAGEVVAVGEGIDGSRARRSRRLRRRRPGQPRRLRQREAQSGLPHSRRAVRSTSRPRRPSARSRCRACAARRRSSAIGSRRRPRADRPDHGAAAARERLQGLGLDLDPARVERATRSALDAGASDPEQFKALVRDPTGGRGADRTLITAATQVRTRSSISRWT